MKSWKNRAKKLLIIQNWTFFHVLAWLPKRPILGRNRNLKGSPCLLSIYSLVARLNFLPCQHECLLRRIDDFLLTRSPLPLYFHCQKKGKKMWVPWDNSSDKFLTGTLKTKIWPGYYVCNHQDSGAYLPKKHFCDMKASCLVKNIFILST